MMVKSYSIKRRPATQDNPRAAGLVFPLLTIRGSRQLGPLFCRSPQHHEARSGAVKEGRVCTFNKLLIFIHELDEIEVFFTQLSMTHNLFKITLKSSSTSEWNRRKIFHTTKNTRVISFFKQMTQPVVVCSKCQFVCTKTCLEQLVDRGNEINYFGGHDGLTFVWKVRMGTYQRNNIKLPYNKVFSK
jgi:hypothetical protein